MLNILACALFDHGWWTFFVVIAYIGAPLPDLLCTRCREGYSDYDEDEGWRSCCMKGWRDGAYFVTGFLLVSGLALPLVLAHNEVVGVPTMIMSLIGGLLVYSSVVLYLKIVHKSDDDEDDDADDYF
jgi:Vacuolar protein sorting 55